MRTLNPKILTFIRKAAVYILLVGFASLSSAEPAAYRANYHEFGVNGKAILCVPSSDMDPLLIPYNDESTDLAVGSGHTPGFGFLFGADRIQQHLDTGMFLVFPEFDSHPYVNKFPGSIRFLSLPDSRRLGSAMRAKDLEDEWSASGRCPDVVVTPFKQSDIFEVQCRATDNYSNVLNRAPDRSKPLPEPNSVVVATCLSETISAGKFTGQTRQPCRRVVVIDGFIVDYQIQKENVQLYQQLDKFLRNKLAEWKGNCLN